MIVAIFGMPSALTTWVLHNVKAAAVDVYGDCSVIFSDTAYDFDRQIAERTSRVFVLYSETPKRELVEAVLKLRISILVVTECLHKVAEMAMRQRSLDAHTALRFASRSICCLELLSGHSSAWRIDKSIFDKSLFVFSEMLSDFVFHDRSDETRRTIRRAISQLNIGAETVRDALSVFERQMLSALPDGSDVEVRFSDELLEVAKEFDTQVSETLFERRFNWPNSIFTQMSDLTYVEGPLDLVGPARVLVGGHALSLPVGKWIMSVEVEVAGNVSGNRILSDIFAEDSVVVRGVCPLPSNGGFSYDLEFRCRDPYYPIIFRIAILEGAIEGSLQLKKVRLKEIKTSN